MKNEDEKREMPKGTKQEMGYCIYCGQGHLISTSGEADQEELNKWATDMCDCEDAAASNRKKKEVLKARKNIELLFSENYAEVAKILKEALPYIVSEQIGKVTADTGRGIKGSASLTNKGRIKVEMTLSDKRTMET